MSECYTKLLSDIIVILPPACEKSSLNGDRTCNESNTENDKLNNYYNLLETRGKGGHAF